MNQKLKRIKEDKTIDGMDEMRLMLSCSGVKPITHNPQSRMNVMNEA